MKKISLFLLLMCSVLLLQAQDLMLINSYHVGHPGSDLRVKGFKHALPKKIQIHELHMDTKRKAATAFANIRQQTLNTFKKIKPDIVVLNDDNALRMLGEHIANTGTPVVFMGINNNPRIYFNNSIPKNVTGVLERHLLIPLVRYFKNFVAMPKKRVLILFDKSKTSSSIIETSLFGKTSFAFGGIDINVQMHESAKDYIRAAQTAAKKYDFIILDTFYTLREGNDKTAKPKDVLLSINRTSKIPVFAVTDYSVGKNAAAGALTMSMEGHGAEAAQMAQQILNGQDISINYRSTKSELFVFNKEMLKKYQIKLPQYISQQAIYR